MEKFLDCIMEAIMFTATMMMILTPIILLRNKAETTKEKEPIEIIMKMETTKEKEPEEINMQIENE